MRIKPFYTIFSILFIGAMLCSVAYAKTPPALVAVAVPANAPKPPSSRFFTQEHILPSLDTLKAEAAAQQAGLPEAGSPTPSASSSYTSNTIPAGPSVRAFRTLSDAAKAGVNPMPKLKPISLGKPIKPTPRTLWTRIHWFVYAGIALLILLSIAYALFSPRLRGDQE